MLPSIFIVAEVASAERAETILLTIATTSRTLTDPSALTYVIEEFSKKFHPNDVDVFAGIESRGFILACALAQKYNKGMILLRKSGKLPGKTIKVSYTIEYGTAEMEIQNDVLEKNQRVLICDDLLATGGTAEAAAKLVEKLGATVVGFAFIIELTELKGIEKIKQYKTEALVQY